MQRRLRHQQMQAQAQQWQQLATACVCWRSSAKWLTRATTLKLHALRLALFPPRGRVKRTAASTACTPPACCQPCAALQALHGLAQRWPVRMPSWAAGPAQPQTRLRLPDVCRAKQTSQRVMQAAGSCLRAVPR